MKRGRMLPALLRAYPAGSLVGKNPHVGAILAFASVMRDPVLQQRCCATNHATLSELVDISVLHLAMVACARRLPAAHKYV